MGIFTQDIKNWTLEELLYEFQYNCEEFYSNEAHPENKRAIEEIKQEIMLRFNVLNSKLKSISEEVRDFLTFQ